VYYGKFNSKEIIHYSGVLQGSIPSPLLYASFINDLCKELANNINDPDFVLNSLFYADDIALFCDSPAKLQILLNICESFSKRFRFSFNIKKCEMVADSLEYPFLLYGQKITFSLSFPYLGLIFDSDGFNEKDYLSLAAKKISNVTGLLKSYGLDAKLYYPSM
jgi:hypothetical protein